METALRPQVIANIPTYFDKGTSNNIENYSLDESGDKADVGLCENEPQIEWIVFFSICINSNKNGVSTILSHIHMDEVLETSPVPLKSPTHGVAGKTVMVDFTYKQAQRDHLSACLSVRPSVSIYLSIDLSIDLSIYLSLSLSLSISIPISIPISIYIFSRNMSELYTCVYTYIYTELHGKLDLPLFI